MYADVIIEVPFHDVDTMHVVWHGHYLKYFEVARCKLLDQFNYNYNYLSALFKKTTGKKISEYYQSRRLETARTLLNSKKKIGEVSEMLNYSSPFAFSKAFKRSFGVSPKQYQTR